MRKLIKMKKRLLWCGFAFAVVLLILMISTESNIIQRIPFLDMMTVNDIRCYNEVSTAKSIHDLDWETSTKITISIFIHVLRIRESKSFIKITYNLFI